MVSYTAALSQLLPAGSYPSPVPARFRSLSAPIPGVSPVPERFRSTSVPTLGLSPVPERFRSISAARGL